VDPSKPVREVVEAIKEVSRPSTHRTPTALSRPRRPAESNRDAMPDEHVGHDNPPERLMNA
jgi:hypothetical protein